MLLPCGLDLTIPLPYLAFPGLGRQVCILHLAEYVPLYYLSPNVVWWQLSGTSSTSEAEAGGLPQV